MNRESGDNPGRGAHVSRLARLAERSAWRRLLRQHQYAQDIQSDRLSWPVYTLFSVAWLGIDALAPCGSAHGFFAGKKQGYFPRA